MPHEIRLLRSAPLDFGFGSYLIFLLNFRKRSSNRTATAVAYMEGVCSSYFLSQSFHAASKCPLSASSTGLDKEATVSDDYSINQDLRVLIITEASPGQLERVTGIDVSE